MTENMPGSFRDDSTSGQQLASSQTASPTPLSEIPLQKASDDKVDKLLCLQREGGVKYLDLLLAKAVSAIDPGSPDIAKIREWTFQDILKCQVLHKKSGSRCVTRSWNPSTDVKSLNL